MESRIESILTNMINDETETIRPQSRIEVLLSQLAEKIENIDQSLTRYRGRVDSVADLPAAGEKAGDWYFVGLVTDTTMSEYAWNGTSWDPIGSSEITVSGLVSYAESQSLQDSEKLTARNNIGLGNVDNTADADKPISTATQTALNGKADAATTYTKTEVDTALSAKADEDTAIQGIKVNNTTINPDSNKVVNITVPTTAADVSALPDTTKYATALSLTINSSTYVMTGQLKDQNGGNLGTAQTIDLPLESVVVGGSYNSQTKKVVLTLQNGNTVEFSVADLVSGLQTELSATNKLNPAYIDYDSTHAAVTEAQRDQITTNKNNILSNWTTGKNIIKTVNPVLSDPTLASNFTITLNADNTFKISGSATTAALIGFEVTLPTGTYTISGCPGGGNAAKYQVDLRNNSWSGVSGADTGNGVQFTNNTAGTYKYTVRIAANYVCNNLLIKPMISTSSDTTYQPYALSNAELTTNKQDKLLTGYSATVTPTSQQTIVATDSVVEGFEKLDNNVRLNENNISTLTPITKTVFATITTANTYQTISDLSCTCPAGKTIHITASGLWNNGYCTGIEIFVGDTLQNTRIIGKTETETGYLALVAIGLYKNTSNDNITVNVAVRQSATGNNTYGVYATVI